VQVKIKCAQKFKDIRTMVQSIEKLVAFTSNILVCILIGKMVLPKRKKITISEMARNILKGKNLSNNF